ncbi:beta-glucosidase [Mucilaginibacter gracilis]|uniref:Beta-glucosidase n=1 Tax=Mucilaginibacter gracilis TaxID=423350 RepID=A0A495IZ60_9SPHI|nr:glycoside hydrolase family 3 C-terminal domain-containing protein [Mucilaginibacter gracilis]RKR81967.1 beta-glucosidase [Mucilaginibacter gracilis]
MHTYKYSFVKVSLLLVALTAFSYSFAQDLTELKISRLLKQMTLEEKVQMIHGSSSFTSGGVKRLGIPELTMSDGPHGVRLEHGRGWNAIKNVDDSGTYLPTGNTLAATWNPQLGYAFGTVLGSEANYRGKDVILGPGINIIRTPLNGRNFEYLSEDPYLVSKMVVGYIKGVQDQGISACVKHFAANNQELNRTSINVEMSERALREIYLPGFKAAVQVGKVNTVMGAYNKFRGQYATENKYLIHDILKVEWGFKGLVMSDWGSVHHTLDALKNGTDIEMGSDLVWLSKSVSQTGVVNRGEIPRSVYDHFFMADSALAMVKSGRVSETFIDDKVARILRVMFKTNMIGTKRKPGEYNTANHQQIALKVAEEGIVLLKNESGILPLKKEAIRSIAIIGENASRENAMGGGSSQIKARYEISPLQGIKNLVDSSVIINYAQGYKIARGQQANEELIKDAVNAVSKSDAAIVFCGWTHGYNYSKWEDNAFDAEGVDKKNLDMPFGQNELISAVLKANPNTIIVLMGAGSIDITQWVDKAKGIIEGWYPGMEGGNALAKVIFGVVNPSGKLPFTFPKKLADSPSEKLGEYPGKDGTEHYNEGIFVGYRYFDTYHVEPQFPFGFGLSYTSFTFKGLSTKFAGKRITATLTVKNVGSRAGAEVVQLYTHKQNSAVSRAEKELKGFEKVFLKAGESKKVTIQIELDALKYYDEVKRNWVIEPGNYDLILGNSSRGEMLRATVKI